MILRKPRVVFLLENSGLLHVFNLVLGNILLALLALLAERVDHVARLAVVLVPAAICFILGVLVSLLLNAPDLLQQLFLSLCIAACNLRAECCTIPLDPIHAILDGFFVGCLFVVHASLLLGDVGLFGRLPFLLLPGCLLQRRLHLILGCLALPRALLAPGSVLVLLSLLLVRQPLLHLLLLPLLLVLIICAPLLDAPHHLVRDLLHLVFLLLFPLILRSLELCVLLGHCQHVVALCPQVRHLMLSLRSDFIHLIIERVLELRVRRCLSSLEVGCILLLMFEAVESNQEIPVVHRLHFRPHRHLELRPDLHTTPLAAGVIIALHNRDSVGRLR
mmetsp:Transcript_119695/g.382035  ORF Transcript_119695/g.382035 Transcript_119695/m.382035 type:complete len:333 (+) Transcript_119695:401-1399(+)